MMHFKRILHALAIRDCLKPCLLILGVAGMMQVHAQELYVFTEPASTMPAHSIAARLTARYPQGGSFRQRYVPALMLAFSKAFMVHASGTMSDFYTPHLKMESGKLYAQWRFYSNDAIHRHFRMAAFAEGAYTASPFTYEELNLDGDHSGVQAGLIATQLLNKLALSASASAIKAFETAADRHAGHFATTALNYTFSAGYLLLPRRYTSYNQPNLNLYLEVIGMKDFGGKGSMLDLAPALQLIVGSNTKINAGYRFQVNGNMLRMASQSWQLSLERTFLGALRKKKS